MLVNMKEMLADAQRGHYAVGLFNSPDLDMMQGIIEAAEEKRAPVIIGPAEVQLPYGTLEHTAAAQIAALMRSVGERWAQEGSATLRSSEIFTAILSAQGVLDVYSVTAKRGGQTFNSTVFDAGTVPTPGAITLTEVEE